MIRKLIRVLPVLACFGACAFPGHAAEAPKLEAASRHPNLAGHIEQSLRYRPDGEDFVIENGSEFFNRPLYGGNTAFRVDAGDRPEFSLYLPGRGGNLRLGVRTSSGVAWLQSAHAIVTRYRPGELEYDIADERLGHGARIKLIAVAYTATEGLGLEVRGEHLPRGAELIFAFGAGNGQRGRRDGDIGTEQVPISQYFQFAPGFARGSRIAFEPNGFRSIGKHATISATTAPAATWRRADANQWQDLAPLLSAPEGSDANVALGTIALDDNPVYLALQVTSHSAPSQLLPAFGEAEVAPRFAEVRRHFDELRNRVRIDTPDPYLNAAMGALNVAADAVWDEDQGAIMHGAIAWRTKLLGWRGPYALDALGWHERARRNFDSWTGRQNTSPVADGLPPADPKANLARNEPVLHSNGDLSNSHYDMNLVFIDAMLRHLLWTGDVAYAKQVWPVLARHLAWEKRLFRREFGPQRLPLYDAYAAIWASDDLYYNGGGVTHTSAYNAWHNQMAAHIARLIGQDPTPYQAEADAIKAGMRQQLWMPERGAFAEYRDALGMQMTHPSYGLWSFYHTMDARVPTPFEAARMAADLDRHLRHIPVTGPGVPADRPYYVLSETDWMPYTWSINNVVLDENLHTALAYWQADRAETAYDIAKGTVLASLYMGVSPGNVGTMNYLDVYRREAQRDFADGAGVMSRALVEGLFGVRPDALAGVLTVHPGFPHDWDHASLNHPDLSLAYRRNGTHDSWTVAQSASRFQRLRLELPARSASVRGVRLDGKPAPWTADASAVSAPRLLVDVPFPARPVTIEVEWDGAAIDARLADSADASAHPGFHRYREGDFSWWETAPNKVRDPQSCTLEGPGWTTGPAVKSTRIDMASLFNDKITNIFKPGKYLAPRSTGVALALPSQGIGAWAGHLNELPVIDDAGLRALGGTLSLPNGLSFATPAGDEPNILFTSQWRNYPAAATVPLNGSATRAFLLMAGSTNHMQSRIDNGEIVVDYASGPATRVALRNPENWWPIEQDYFVDDYQFPLCGQLPVRIDLKSAQVHVPDPATFKGKGRGAIDGGAATVIEVPLDPSRQLKDLTVHAMANDVVIGLMAVTLDR